MFDCNPQDVASICDWSRPSGQSPARCWISFGGNVGDVKATFDAALALLSLHCHIHVLARSGIYQTVPMGVQAGSIYLNSVCGLETTLSPHDLLRVLQKVEDQMGRERDIRWGPRTLDLDLLSYSCRVLDLPELVIPHPALTYRRFVLDPLAELDLEWRHPECGLTARELRDRLKSRPLQISIVDGTADELLALVEKLSSRFPEALFVPDTISEPRLRIVAKEGHPEGCPWIVDLRRSPGDLIEKLSSALTAIFDEPRRISDW